MKNLSLKLLLKKTFYACSLKIMLTCYRLINYRQNTAFHTKNTFKKNLGCVFDQ